MFSHVAITLFVSIKTRPDFATSSDSKISGFARPRGSKLFADSKISVLSLESGFKKLRIRVEERQIRKVKVADSKISGTCGRGLNDSNKLVCVGTLFHALKASVNFGPCTSVHDHALWIKAFTYKYAEYHTRVQWFI